MGPSSWQPMSCFRQVTQLNAVVSMMLSMIICQLQLGFKTAGYPSKSFQYPPLDSGRWSRIKFSMRGVIRYWNFGCWMFRQKKIRRVTLGKIYILPTTQNFNEKKEQLLEFKSWLMSLEIWRKGGLEKQPVYNSLRKTCILGFVASIHWTLSVC